MTTIDLETLDHVTGGAVVSRTSTNDAITQSLATIQSSLSTLSTNNNSSQSNMLLPMVMMMAMNRRQTVIAGGGATYVG